MAKKARSSYNRSWYNAKRKTILRKAKAYYKTHRTKILARQKRYRMKTKAGTSAYKPLYARGNARGKRPLYARMPRLNVYSFISRKRGKPSKALGRKAPSFRRGGTSNTGRKPMKGGRRAFKSA